MGTCQNDNEVVGMKEIYTPRVLQCMRFQHKSDTGVPVRTVMDYEFDFCLGCNRELWIEDIRYELRGGCFVIRKPGQRVASKGVYDCYMLTLDFSNRSMDTHYSRNTANQMQEPFESKMWEILPAVFQPAHGEDYLRIFEDLASINEMDLNDNPRTQILINRLLHLVLSDAFLYQYTREDPTQSAMDRVCAYLKTHYREELRLEDLAAVAHLNKNYLVRLFKKRFGISPVAYLIKIRMDYAKKLLSESDLPVKTVAAACGYRDPSFFNAYFKKLFQISPAAYRRSCRQP